MILHTSAHTRAKLCKVNAFFHILKTFRKIDYPNQAKLLSCPVILNQPLIHFRIPKNSFPALLQYVSSQFNRKINDLLPTLQPSDIHTIERRRRRKIQISLPAAFRVFPIPEHINAIVNRQNTPRAAAQFLRPRTAIFPVLAINFNGWKIVGKNLFAYTV